MKVQRRSWQELIPWVCPVSDGLILQKDGSLLANFLVKGIDIDCPDGAQVDACFHALDKACACFGNQHTLWWRLDHRRIKHVPESQLDNPIAQQIEAMHTESLAHQYFENQHSLSVLCTPQSGIEKWIERCKLHLNYGAPLYKAFYLCIKEYLLRDQLFHYQTQQVQQHMNEFEALLTRFCGGLSQLGLSRLRLNPQYEFLHQCVNPFVTPRKLSYPSRYLDDLLPETEMTIGKEMVSFSNSEKKVFASVLALKELPNMTQSRMIENLAAVDAEFTFSLMLRCLDQSESKQYVEGLERHYRFTQFTLRNVIKLMMRTEDEDVDPGRIQIAEMAHTALAKITAENLQFAYASANIICYGESPEEAENATRKVVQALAKNSIGLVRETLNLSAAFASTIPGQWRENEFLHFVSMPNLSDLAPLISADSGSDTNLWLSEQRGSVMPSLTRLPTRHRTLSHINFHVDGGNGHLLVVGPTGAGKSVFLNFLSSQIGKYLPRRFTFDRDRSCRIATLLNDGKFIDIAGQYQGATAINPCSLLQHPRHHHYVGEWLVLMIESFGYRCDVHDLKSVSEAVHLLSQFSPNQWRLLNFVGLLPERLKNQLAPWCEGGKNARFFDHVEDAFELSDEVCIEMGQLMDHYPEAAALAIDYFFYRIQDALCESEGRPSYIKIEEGAFFISHPIFSKRLQEAAVTLRKRNCSIWLATQSLSQIKSCASFSILQESFKSKIFLPNASAGRDLYCDLFHLSEDQYQQVKTGIPNRDYLLINPQLTRMLQAHFPKEIIALTRSDERAQKLLDQAIQSGKQDWKNQYLKEILHA